MARLSISSLGDRVAQKAASLQRWEDAKALLCAGRHRGAMYLAGYCLECGLKAKLMEEHRAGTLRQLGRKLRKRTAHGSRPDFHTHDLERLVKWLPGVVWGAGDTKVCQSWRSARRWSVDWRYASDDPPLTEAETFMENVKEVVQWLDNRQIRQG